MSQHVPIPAKTRFHRLVTVRRVENRADKMARYECLCDCGATTIARARDLRIGGTKSCGCLHKDLARTGMKRRWRVGETPNYLLSDDEGF